MRNRLLCIALVIALVSCKKDVITQAPYPEDQVTDTLHWYTLQAFGSDGEQYHYSYIDSANQFHNFSGLVGDILSLDNSPKPFRAKQGSVKLYGTNLVIVKID